MVAVSYLGHYDTGVDIITKLDCYFITKCDRTFFCLRFSVTKCDKLFTNWDSYYKMRQFYYKMQQLFQNVLFITNCVVQTLIDSVNSGLKYTHLYGAVKQ